VSNAVAIIAMDITERQRAQEKIRSLASELTIAEQEERHRISQILHDDLQQRLFALKAQLSFLYEALDGERLPPRAQREMEEIQSALSDAIYVTRNLSVDLSPVVLHGEGLPEAIAWLASRMKEKQGLVVDLKVDPDFPNFERNTRVMLFQTLRELLFNVVKHAEKQEASVAMEQVGGLARITVSDGGKGFDMQDVMSDPDKAHSLTILRDRLNLRGWDMEIDSRPGHGTRVVIKIPPERNTEPE
jgi:signal transduction histidine kinase